MVQVIKINGYNKGSVALEAQNPAHQGVGIGIAGGSRGPGTSRTKAARTQSYQRNRKPDGLRGP